MKQQKTLLRHLRREREITLDVLSLATGINVSTLSRVERGLVQPTDQTLARLAKYFKVSADELLNAPQQVAS